MLRYLLKHPLARKHLTKAIFRVGKWQIYRRLLGRKMMVVPFIGSTRLFLQKNEQAALGNWYYGLSEFEMMSFVLHFLRPGDHFADVGANIGAYSILASGICRAQSIAFEPVPKTFEMLKNQIGLNQLERMVKLYPLGLADQPGQLHFTTLKGQQNHMIGASQQHTSATAIEVTTMDQVFSKQKPTLLKIDVEGFETAVLQGGEQTLRHPGLKAIIIETMGLGSRYGFDENKIHNKLKSLGFRAFNYHPFSRDLTPLRKTGNQTLYLRAYEMVSERIKSAPLFEVFGQKI